MSHARSVGRWSGTWVLLVAAAGCGAANPARTALRSEAPRVSWEAEVRACVSGGECNESCEARLDEGAGDAVLRGDLARLCGRDADALAAYERAFTAAPASCALARAVAELRAARGDAAGALAIAAGAPPCRALDELILREPWASTALEPALRRRLGEDPDDVLALAAQVRLLIARGADDLTSATCVRAATLSAPELDDACATVAITSDAQHDAEQHLRRAVEREPTAARWGRLGRFLVGQRRFPDAAHALREALSRDGRDYDATVDLARAFGHSCWTDARALLERAQRLTPTRPEAWLRFGELTADEPRSHPVHEARRSISALERFVALSEGRPELAEAREGVARVCRRRSVPRPPSSRRRRMGQSQWMDDCEPGLLQLHMLSDGPLPEMAQLSSPGEPVDCSFPELPPIDDPRPSTEAVPLDPRLQPSP